MTNRNAVKEAMNIWGRNFLRERGRDVADDAEITFTDYTSASPGYSSGCNTCGSFPEVEYEVEISDGPNYAMFYGSMFQIVREMTEEI